MDLWVDILNATRKIRKTDRIKSQKGALIRVTDDYF